MAGESSVTSGAPSAPSAPAEAATRKRRRWPWVLAALLLLGLAFLALLPTILSTGPFLRLALGQINKRISGKLEIGSWSLGWFSGFKLDGIRLSDAQGVTVAEVKSVTLPASVPALLRSRKRIGTVEIAGLQAAIVFPPVGSNNLAKAVARGGDSAAPAPAKEVQPLGFDLAGAIAVRNGRIAVYPGGPARARPYIIRDLNANAWIESLGKPIRFDLKAALGEERAPLLVIGSATVLHNGKPAADAFEADFSVALSGLELAPLSAVARQYGAPLAVAGNLTAGLSAQVSGLSSLSAKGDLSVKRLSLSGGPLGEDRPQFDYVSMGFDASSRDGRLSLRRFQLESPTFSASVFGSVVSRAVGSVPSGSLSAHAELELPALAAQLGDTLKLRKGLTIESGKVTLDSTLASDEKGRRLNGTLCVENLAAVSGGRRIATEAPITLIFQASKAEKGARIDNLEFTSSFAGVRGSGTLEEFDLEGDVDLQAALHEAEKFVDLSGRAASGKAHVALHISGPDPHQKNVSGKMTLTGLLATGFAPGPLQLDEADAALSAVALLDRNGPFLKLSRVKLDFSAGKIADGAITADSVTIAPERMCPVLANANLSLNVDLAEATRLARGMNLMPSALGLSGKLNCNSCLAVDKGTVRLDPVVGAVTDFELSQGERHIREPKVSITGATEASLADRTAGIHDLTCRFAAGTVTLQSLLVPDWAAAPLSGVTATAEGDFDIERLLVSLKDFSPLSDDAQVAGHAAFALKATLSSAAQQVALQAALNALKVACGTGKTVQEEKLTLDAAAVIAPGARTVTFDSLRVVSTFFTLSAKGAFKDWSNARDLSAEGTLRCNWDRIGAVAAALSGQPIEASGSDSVEFRGRTSFGDKSLRTILERSDAAAGISLARLKVMGIEATGIRVPITVKNDVPSARVEAAVNGGRLLVPAEVDWSELLPELVWTGEKAVAQAGTVATELVSPVMVLKDVKLTSEMADEGLSRVSPVFKGCAVAGGTVSLDSQQLDVQLGRIVSVGRSLLKRAVFDGGLSFSNVSLKPAGLLQSVLALTGAAGPFDGTQGRPDPRRTGGAQLLSLPDQRVPLALRDGRVIQGPMVIAAGEYRFKLAGSVGLADRTLDYLVELPISPAMLGGADNLYRLLKGEVITVPIKGTTDHPQLDKDAFGDDLKRLIESAAKKLVEQESGDLLQKTLEDLFRK